MAHLLSSSELFYHRFDNEEHQWVAGIQAHLERIAEMREAHVHQWLKINTSRFQAETESVLFEEARRLYSELSVSLYSGIRLCTAQCAKCYLLCLRPKSHSGEHSCNTEHKCLRHCEYADEHNEPDVFCGLPYV